MPPYTVLVFTWINWIKLPFFCLDRSWVDSAWLPAHSIINRHTLLISATYLPLVPLGVWIGVWLNRRFSDTGFLRFVYVATFPAGLQLIFDFHFGL
mgnify:CR=1 FL=1